MTEANFAKARQRTLDHLRDAGIVHHMLHGPSSDDYWSAPLRVLVVNMESYGYSECGHWNVDLECLLERMYDRGKTGTKTVRYTLAMIKVLIDAYTTKTVPSPKHFKAAYAGAPSLEVVLREIAYYNIRPTSNLEKREDTANIIASGSTVLSEFVRDEMLALDPKVILIAGSSGLKAFNTMWSLNPSLRYLDSIKHPCGAVVQSIKHPSRADYKVWTSTISNVIQQLNAP